MKTSLPIPKLTIQSLDLIEQICKANKGLPARDAMLLFDEIRRLWQVEEDAKAVADDYLGLCPRKNISIRIIQSYFEQIEAAERILKDE